MHHPETGSRKKCTLATLDLSLLEPHSHFGDKLTLIPSYLSKLFAPKTGVRFHT